MDVAEQCKNVSTDMARTNQEMAQTGAQLWAFSMIGWRNYLKLWESWS